MGLRARLERDLGSWQKTLEVMQGITNTGLLDHGIEAMKKRAKRRIHLLEFVLSGRYTELERKAEARRLGFDVR